MIDFVRNGGGSNWIDSLGKSQFDNDKPSFFALVEDTFRQLNALDPSSKENDVAIDFPIEVEDLDMMKSHVQMYLDFIFSVLTQVKGVDSPQDQVVLGSDAGEDTLRLKISGKDGIDDEQMETVSRTLEALKQKYFGEKVQPVINHETQEQVGYSTNPEPGENPEDVIALFATIMYVQRQGNMEHDAVEKMFGMIEYESLDVPAVLIKTHAFEEMRDVEMGHNKGPGIPDFSLN